MLRQAVLISVAIGITITAVIGTVVSLSASGLLLSATLITMAGALLGIARLLADTWQEETETGGRSVRVATIVRREGRRLLKRPLSSAFEVGIIPTVAIAVVALLLSVMVATRTRTNTRTPDPGGSFTVPTSVATSPGTAMTTTITVEESARRLVTLEPVTGAVTTGPAHVVGSVYKDSLIVPLGQEATAVSIEYDLGRRWSVFETTAAISDDAPSASMVRFQITLDGITVHDMVLSLGESRQLRVDVSGVLRLRLTAVHVTDLAGGTRAVWGSPQLRE